MNSQAAHARAAMLAAADWLEANPMLHIQHEYAKDDQGHTANPRSVHATCFCAWGRVMREFYGTWDTPFFGRIDELHCVVKQYDPNYGEIMTTNDYMSYSARPQAIATLRRRATLLPVD